ncbi:hypothetical protein [Spirosoma flavum]|uniref:Uncharacterized protein n=1 Tax=Spirosoma flavum TaxID=2048557 RepID=A0ABW6AGD4_9BACT
MKMTFITASLFLTIGLTQLTQAQSTTGSRSGGSTSSTGTGYLTEGKRAAETNPSSMTIADEGASRAYMYVPPTSAKNRSASPDGSTGLSPNHTKVSAKGKTPGKTATPKKSGAQP